MRVATRCVAPADLHGVVPVLPMLKGLLFSRSAFVFALASLLTSLAARADAARLTEFTLGGGEGGPPAYTIGFDSPVPHRHYDLIIERGFYYIDFYGIDSPAPDGEWRVDRDGILLVRRFYYPQHKVLRLVFYTNEPFDTMMDLSVSGATFSLTPRKIPFRLLPESPSVVGGSRKVVFIDPGHGGKSGGARTSQKINGRHYEEKDVVLDIAKRMIPLFQRSPNIDVKLSRIRDNYVSLEDRIRMSEQVNADLFVSVHLNASSSRSSTATGFEVYYLSDNAHAKNDRLVKLENDVGLREANGGMDARELHRILGDISDKRLKERRPESKLLSHVVELAFRNHGPFRGKSRGVKTAGFHVLMNYNAPAVLVECGFLDNPRDAAVILDPQKQEEMAALLFNAINMYFARTDPNFQAHLVSVR